MGIEREIESITIAFEEPYRFYGESVVKEILGINKNKIGILLKLKFQMQFLIYWIISS